jgi:hypothetical protein
METFITDVSTTRTNIAIASRMASLRSPLARAGALVPDSLVIAGSPSRQSLTGCNTHIADSLLVTLAIAGIVAGVQIDPSRVLL